MQGQWAGEKDSEKFFGSKDGFWGKFVNPYAASERESCQSRFAGDLDKKVRTKGGLCLSLKSRPF